MLRLLVIALLLSNFAGAQTKKPVQKNAKSKAVADSLKSDSVVAEVEKPMPREFAVYTKKPKLKTERMKLCLNLVSKDTVLNYCINDSICRDPEITKILFEKKDADSTYLLVYVDAFSKPVDKPECDAGKELKLFFIRWNTKTNKALVKHRTVESCMRGVTNMTREPILNWDRVTPLTVNYYKGNSTFSEIKFDPQQYLLGFQSADTESK